MLKILKEGNGALFSAPPPCAELLKEVLSQHKVAFTCPKPGSKLDAYEGLKVLVMNRNYVVAEEFKVVELGT